MSGGVEEGKNSFIEPSADFVAQQILLNLKLNEVLHKYLNHHQKGFNVSSRLIAHFNLVNQFKDYAKECYYPVK
ncbi:hypothetical protein BLOT_006379 [Blomia tropicalis]|nr:hypothetical protein BLOT_006379 [Blomia tropicalis]